ncbi:Adaptor protein complex AP-3 delta subunit [Gymnopilus junonius]|uniref:AP-3 complex subunit delta n=1 Tax=Gymnopilus junonius TaxID=109634 RepID=A0A9P5P2M6_GYMJU|nr:Adaptor protein complex AP-3 delta subunit [Gymnopilus junonius]
MWERTLQDLVRGLRANKKDEAKFIAKAVDEIRQEIKTDDMELKAGAVLKLTYLDMLGYDMSWASFHVVEVMSSPKAHLKSIGYLAASQSFEQDTDVLMLTTNLLKKDLSSTPADIAISLDGLSHIVTPELARDLTPELVAMLNHSRPSIRKRAILALYKMLLKYPEAITQARSRLGEKLDDSDPSVVAATVNVLCELARRNPRDYLSLAPQLFHLLTSSSNNWMLIKIIKLFGSLSPHEPRLVKKLQPPITELISTTPAISLLYECVHTCIIGGMLQGPSGDSLAKICVSKLAAFIQDADQNLKYIALLAMAKIVPTHPHLIAEYQDTILLSVDDQDISIRMRALDLLSAMANRSNLQSIAQQLLTHLVRDTSTVLPTAAQSLAQNNAPPSLTATNTFSPSQSSAYRLTLAQRILSLCSRSTYENVSNFEWYLSVLVDLSHVANVDVGAEIRDQLVDVVGRVRGVRRYAVKLMYTLLSDDTILRNATEEGSCSEVLWAAAWICGEYCLELSEPQKLIPYLLQAEITNLTPDIIATYIQAATKIFGVWAAELAQQWKDAHLSEVKDIVETVLITMRQLVNSQRIEVQERASNALQIFTFIQADLNSYRPEPVSMPLAGPSSIEGNSPTEAPRFPKSLYLIQPLFDSYELNPVAANAQASVAIPDGLDLDTWIVLPPFEVTAQNNVNTGEKKKKLKKGKGKEVQSSAPFKKKKAPQNGQQILLTLIDSDYETPEEKALFEKRKAERLAQLRDDPYYIMDHIPKPIEDVDSIPVVHLDGMPPIPHDLHDDRLPTLRATSQTFSSESFVIEKDGEMPQRVISPPPGSLTAPVLSTGTPAAPVRVASFPEYEVPEEVPPVETIKVVRTKKKGPTKRKRTAPVDNMT